MLVGLDAKVLDVLVRLIGPRYQRLFATLARRVRPRQPPAQTPGDRGCRGAAGEGLGLMHLPRLAVVALTGPTYRLSLHHRLSVRMQRWLSEVGAGLLRPPRGTHVERVELGGRPAERVSFGASHRPRAVLYLHGGGYVVGSARMYRALAGYLARTSGAVVFTLDYRLAPEHAVPGRARRRGRRVPRSRRRARLRPGADRGRR